MSDDFSMESRILKAMKKVLTDVARDTHVTPGMKHSLTDDTIRGIRDCLVLITARESEIAEAEGRPVTSKPRFTDEPQDSVVVQLHQPGADDSPDK